VAEQSHKDDMRAALRGDFDRLRERRRRGGRPESPEAPVREQSERIVLTPAQPAGPREAVTELPAPVERTPPPSAEKRSRLRSFFRREG
jgi:hypothetical protein